MMQLTAVVVVAEQAEVVQVFTVNEREVRFVEPTGLLTEA
jgi:hypothetical protein